MYLWFNCATLSPPSPITVSLSYSDFPSSSPPSYPYPASCRPANYNPSFFNHRFETCIPVLPSSSRDRSIICLVNMYYLAGLWCLNKYISISSRPTTHTAFYIVGVVPYPVGLSLQLLFRNPSLYPVVEYLYYPIYVGSYHPCLHAKCQESLYDGQV